VGASLAEIQVERGNAVRCNGQERGGTVSMRLARDILSSSLGGYRSRVLPMCRRHVLFHRQGSSRRRVGDCAGRSVVVRRVLGAQAAAAPHPFPKRHRQPLGLPRQANSNFFTQSSLLLVAQSSLDCKHIILIAFHDINVCWNGMYRSIMACNAVIESLHATHECSSHIRRSDTLQEVGSQQLIF